MFSILRGQGIAHGPVRPDFERFWSDFGAILERFWREIWTLRADFLRCLSDFERSAGRQLVEQAGERLGSLSIDNILLSERLSKYWRNICHPTDMPYCPGGGGVAVGVGGCLESGFFTSRLYIMFFYEYYAQKRIL